MKKGTVVFVFGAMALIAAASADAAQSKQVKCRPPLGLIAGAASVEGTLRIDGAAAAGAKQSASGTLEVKIYRSPGLVLRRLTVNVKGTYSRNGLFESADLQAVSTYEIGALSLNFAPYSRSTVDFQRVRYATDCGRGY